MRCGHLLVVRSCGACDEDRPGSGSYASHATRTCKTRACATCAAVRAQNTADLMEKAFDTVKPIDGYRWQSVVLTTRYDPRDPEDLTRAALRSRAMLCAKLGRRAWDKQLDVDGAAMLRTTEVSERGMVHANLIYYGPPVDKDALDELLAKTDRRAGFCKVFDLDWDPVVEEDERGRKKHKRVKSEDPRGSKEAVKRASRYAAKGLKHAKEHTFDEEWLAGDKSAQVVDEVLAARWEIAVYKLKLTQRYGDLLGIDYDEHATVEPESDEHVACESCGVVGEWKSVLRKAESWLQQCHDRGKPGLERSRWLPSREAPD